MNKLVESYSRDLNARAPVLIALFLFAILGAVLAKNAWQGIQEAQNQSVRMDGDLIGLADSLATRQEHILNQTSNLMKVLAGISVGSETGKVMACEPMLARQLDSFPEYDNLAFSGPDGLMQCSARPEPGMPDLALEGTKPRSVALVTDPAHISQGRLLFSTPRISLDGQVTGTVLATLPVESFLHPRGIRVQQDNEIALVDEAGNLLAAYPSRPAWAGTDVEHPFVEKLLALEPHVVTRLSNPDGTEHLYVMKPILGAGAKFTLIVGHTVDKTYHTPAWHAALALAAMGLMALTLSALAVLTGSAFFRALKETTGWQPPHVFSFLPKAFISTRESIRQKRLSGPPMVQTASRADTTIRKAYEELKHSFAFHEERTRQISRLDKLSLTLLECSSTAEVAAAVMLCARDLFPGSSGALLLKSKPDWMEAIATWGDSARHDTFRPEDCRTLSPGQSEGENRTVTAPCAQCASPLSEYVCSPLIAKSELIGILRVDEPGAGNHSVSTDSMPWAAKSIAERAAIGLCSVRRQERLQFQATRDTLTGLYNRRFMEETIRNEERRAVRRDTSIGFMMLDVDNFKRFNDTFGHDAGDTVLRTIGKVIRKVVREEDIPCRYGGEEFVVVLPGADLQDTRQRAETLRSAVERLAVKHGGGTVAKITISVGVASFPQHGSNCQDVLKLADQALYTAKHAGRNRVAMPPAKQ